MSTRYKDEIATCLQNQWVQTRELTGSESNDLVLSFVNSAVRPEWREKFGSMMNSSRRMAVRVFLRGTMVGIESLRTRMINATSSQPAQVMWGSVKCPIAFEVQGIQALDKLFITEGDAIGRWFEGGKLVFGYLGDDEDKLRLFKE
jgi:hypothetical protein